MDIKKILNHGAGLVGGLVRQGWGLAQRVPGLRSSQPKDLDDVTLARKVETEVFRLRDAPKRSVVVTVVDGVVELRGEVKRPAHVNTIEARVRAIPEVKGVENLLHLAKTPAPTRTDTPARQRKSPTRERNATAPRTPPTKVTDDQTDRVVETAEPTPVELAAEGKGRQPAPFGSEGGGEGRTDAGEGASESTADPSVSPTGTP
jgi:hypothetical protein